MQYVLKPTQNDILHYGKGHDDSPPGRGSGRYAWGSGKESGNKEPKNSTKKPSKIEAGRTISDMHKQTSTKIDNILEKRDKKIESMNSKIDWDDDNSIAKYESKLNDIFIKSDKDMEAAIDKFDSALKIYLKGSGYISDKTSDNKIIKISNKLIKKYNKSIK